MRSYSSVFNANSLAVTKRIIDLHGGKIEVYSEGEGRGTVFTIELPVYKRAKVLARDGRPQALFSISSFSAQLNSNSVRSQKSPRSISDAGGSSRNISERRNASFRNIRAQSPESSLRCAAEGTTSTTLEMLPAADSKTDMFPIREIEDVDTPRLMEEWKSGKAPQQRPGSDSLRILIVDDAKMNRKMLSRLLHDRCGVTGEAADGDEVGFCTALFYLINEYNVPGRLRRSA